MPNTMKSEESEVFHYCGSMVHPQPQAAALYFGVLMFPIPKILSSFFPLYSLNKCSWLYDMEKWVS